MRSDLRSIFGHPVHIYLLCDEPELTARLRALWPAEEVEWQVFSTGKLLLECLFTDPPEVLITSVHARDVSGLDVVRMVKGENVYRQVCAVLLLDQQTLGQVNWAQVEADDLVLLTMSEEEMRSRIELAIRRSTRTLDANPLTKLPGNSSIMQAIQRYTDTGLDFALGYIDIDNFKSFNDKYGFSRGDEALFMTARVIITTVTSMNVKPNFVGHIGGDDFVFILPIECAEEVCKKLIASYDAIVPNFYDEEDRRRGAIEAHDRQGVLHTYPLLSISIAVVLNKNGRFTHFAEMSQIAGQVKKLVKTMPGSCYVIDRRER